MFTEVDAGMNGRYYYVIQGGRLLPFRARFESESKGKERMYEVSVENYVRVDMLEGAVDITVVRRGNVETMSPVELLKQFEVDREKSDTMEEEFHRMLENITRFTSEHSITLALGNNLVLRKALQDAIDPIAALLPSKKATTHFVTAAEKEIYQLWVLKELIETVTKEAETKGIDVSADGEWFLSRTVKGLTLDHPKHLVKRYEREYGAFRISGATMSEWMKFCRTTIGRPTAQVVFLEEAGESINFYLECQLKARDVLIRPDLVVSKGALFDARVVREIAKYGKREEDPDLLSVMQQPELVVEVKTFESGITKAVIDQLERYTVLNPALFLFVSRRRVPATLREDLKGALANVRILDGFRPKKEQKKEALTAVMEEVFR